MLEECMIPGFPEKVLCGTLNVYEDYNAENGKKIPIEVVVLPSKSSTPSPSAFTMHWGGNGDAAKNKIWFFRPGSAADQIRSSRDIVLIDDRGTGASHIKCSAMDSLQPYAYAFVYDKGLILDCLQEVQDKIRLEFYNTPGVVADYNHVREWLGLEQFDFYGISYGVRVGLEFMKTYPTHMRSLTVHGCVPPGFNYVNEMDIAIQEQLEILMERCHTDSACHQFYPNFRKELYAIRDKLVAEPIQVDFELENGSSKQITIDDLLFRRIVGHQILNGNANEALPLLIHRAYAGNFAPLIVAGGNLSLDMPVFLSQFCPEEINRFDYTIENASSALLFTQGAIAWEKKMACNQWPEMPLANWLDEPLQGDCPILILTGEYDANTPIRMGQQIRQAFPGNSRHIVLPYQGHASTESTCRFSMIAQFVETKSLRTIDTLCLSSIQPASFAYEVALSPNDFDQYAGTYAAEDSSKLLTLFQRNGIYYLTDEYSRWSGPSQLLYKGAHRFSLLDCDHCKIEFEMEQDKVLHVNRIYRDTSVFVRAE